MGYMPMGWIVDDVIEVMKEQYQEITDESPIFIAGLSMGGFGALRLGAKYPTVFKAFSGLSSITHFNQISEFVADFEQLKHDALEQDSVLEWILENKETISPFRFDCSGGHTWEYWSEHLAKTLLFFNKYS